MESREYLTIMWKCINLQLCIICWLRPPLLPPLPSVDVFFRLEVQRLSCPQHVLVLRSAAARTCDDRVCERRGVSGVKCAYRGCVAGRGM